MRKLILFFTIFLTTTIFSQTSKSLISKRYDKFDKKTEYSGSAGSLGVYCTKNDGDTSMSYSALSILVYDSYLTHAEGLILLFSDGTTLELETTRELGSYSSKNKLWEYYAFAHPTIDEWTYISNHKIVGFKFHIFERNFTQSTKLNNIIKQLKIDSKIEIKNEFIEAPLITKEKVDMDDTVYNTAGIDQIPMYVGGIEEFYSFFKNEFKKPAEEDLKGKVYVTFVVEKDGSLTDIKVLRDIGYGTGDETVRVLKMSPCWVAGKQNGKKVRVLYSIPISI